MSHSLSIAHNLPPLLNINLQGSIIIPFFVVLKGSGTLECYYTLSIPVKHALQTCTHTHKKTSFTTVSSTMST